ncbi:DAK2 domain-containing protein [Atopobium fossor]|uniref:DAK2 domain-containing protein n=1 Tax=Atopobium fossor TaxID=39487 RepID=UPI0004137317|nr:DAK2 domain-containing protein [Atopobium fossor]
MISSVVRKCFPVAAQVVATKAEDINKLNVFPVPDGDTGTNMSLTLGTVVGELNALPADSDMAAIAKAITHGSLMGARGNSGVITSQILRGVAEGLVEADENNLSSADIARAFQRGQKVAFQAVRKPVEGTILTVLRDVTTKASECAATKMSVENTLTALVVEAYESVARTPDLLPVLKENGVVDSGAFGFATFMEAFVNCALDNDTTLDFSPTIVSDDEAKAHVSAKVAIELNDDWEGSEFRYCNEFLFQANDDSFDEDAALKFLSTMGDCELLVGDNPTYKVHVHSNNPDQVLKYMLQYGQVFNVFIHNMDLEAQERTEKIASDQQSVQEEETALPHKELGFVAVAAGDGEADILKSLGVDVVVSGGQTMNPSTADIITAINKVNADKVIVLPNNSNIRMTAEAASGSFDEGTVGVVPTKTVPQAFAAMFSVDPDASLTDNVEAMTEAIAAVRDGEVTTAVRDSAAADGTPIHNGDVLGIVQGVIEAVGNNVAEVTLDIINRMQEKQEGDTLTILAGSDMSDEDFEALCAAIEQAQPDLEIDSQRGGQPLYPVIFSIE